MHSYVIAQDILQAVLSEAVKYEGEQVESIHIELEDDSFREAESVRFCLESLAVGTPIERIPIEISRTDSEIEYGSLRVFLHIT